MKNNTSNKKYSNPFNQNKANQSLKDNQLTGKETNQKESFGRITHKEINVQKIIKDISDTKGNSGAITLFIGTVRNYGNKGKILSMTYESYISMAEEKIKSIEEYALKKWNVQKIKIIHRVGNLKVGTNSIVIAVSSAHSRDAYMASKFILKKIKNEVPIWKKEKLVDGREIWVEGQVIVNPTIN